jgi:hypothetical protein
LADEYPDFTPAKFSESQPYNHESYRQALFEALTLGMERIIAS